MLTWQRVEGTYSVVSKDVLWDRNIEVSQHMDTWGFYFGFRVPRFTGLKLLCNVEGSHFLKLLRISFKLQRLHMKILISPGQCIDRRGAASTAMCDPD